MENILAVILEYWRQLVCVDQTIEVVFLFVNKVHSEAIKTLKVVIDQRTIVFYLCKALKW